MSSRTDRPPVSDPNPPASRRKPPPEVNTPAVTPVGTNPVTNVGTSVPNQVPTAPAPAQALDLSALLHGRIDPEDDRAQTGVRLPKYVTDAVRAVSNASRGRASMQDLVTNAVKAYLPADVLRQAWLAHGGTDDQGAQQ